VIYHSRAGPVTNDENETGLGMKQVKQEALSLFALQLFVLAILIKNTEFSEYL